MNSFVLFQKSSQVFKILPLSVKTMWIQDMKMKQFAITPQFEYDLYTNVYESAPQLLNKQASVLAYANC